MINFLAYMLSSVTAMIYTYFATNNYSVELVLLCAAIFVQIFFSLASWGNIFSSYIVLLENKYIYFKMLVSTFVLWWLTMYITNIVSPTFFEIAFTIITNIIATYLDYKERHKLHSMYLIIALLILLFMSLRFLYDNYSIYQATLITLETIVMGVSSVVYSHTSVEMGRKLKLNTTAILATRFWLTIISLAVYVLVNDKGYHQYTATSSFYFHIILLSILMFIIPLYCYQKALMKLGANKTLIFLGISPVLVFIGEYLNNLGSHTDIYLLYIAIGLFIVTSVYQGKEFYDKRNPHINS